MAKFYATRQRWREFGAFAMSFFGILHGRDYWRKLAIAIGLLLVGTLAFRPVVWVIGVVVGPAGGHLGLLASMALKPILTFSFFLVFASALVRRARDAGVGPWVGAGIAALAVTDAQTILFAGGSWAFAFSAGILAGTTPLGLLAALAMAVAIGFAPRSTRRVRLRGAGFRLGVVAIALWSIAMVFLVVGAISSIAPESGRTLVFAISSVGLLPLWRAPATRPVLLIALVAVAGLLAYRARTVADSAFAPSDELVGTDGASDAARTKAAKTATVIGVVAGLSIAVGLYTAIVLPALSIASGPLILIVMLGGPILTTAAIYGAPVAFAVYAVQTRSRAAIVCLALCSLPFLGWFLARQAAHTAEAADQALVSAIPVQPPTKPIDVLEFRLDHAGSFDRTELEAAGIRRFFVTESRASRAFNIFEEPPREDLPPERLQITTLREIGAGGPAAQLVTVFGGPVVLREITPSGPRIIGVWYRSTRIIPSVLPILYGTRWFGPQRNVIRVNQDDFGLGAFVRARLAPASGNRRV